MEFKTRVSARCERVGLNLGIGLGLGLGAGKRNSSLSSSWV